MICKIHHMESNMSEIRLSFVIIAKSYSTTCVIWHDKNCSESSPCAFSAWPRARPSKFAPPATWQR